VDRQALKPLLAEALGTFFLCFIGIGAICAFAAGAPVGLLGIAVAHGLALAIGVTVTGPISGGHLNPAVTAAFVATGRMLPTTGLKYVGSQCLGAVVAALLAGAVFAGANAKVEPGKKKVSVLEAAQFGTPTPNAKFSAGSVFVAEAALTFLLVTAVFGTAVDGRAPRLGGLAIGLTVFFDILMGGAVSGAAMNPARVFGPALVGGVWKWHLLYWAGPVFGGCLAGIFYTWFYLPVEADAKPV